MFTYPVQRHRLPEMAIRISSSDGLGLSSKNATPVIIIPGVTEATLQAVFFGKSLLDGVKLPTLFQAFHSLHLSVIGLDGKDSA